MLRHAFRARVSRHKVCHWERDLRQSIRRQRLWDQIGDLNNGGFLAHRNPKESEDELEIIHSTCAGASGVNAG